MLILWPPQALLVMLLTSQVRHMLAQGCCSPCNRALEGLSRCQSRNIVQSHSFQGCHLIGAICACTQLGELRGVSGALRVAAESLQRLTGGLDPEVLPSCNGSH